MEEIKSETRERLNDFLEKEGLILRCADSEINTLFYIEKKIPEVKYMGWDYSRDYNIQFYFNLDIEMVLATNIEHLGNHLAKCLQEYLSEQK